MSTKDILKPYRATLTPGQVADGMNAAVRNAQRLLDDAKLLLANGRWPSAASMAALCIEESGKLEILRRFLIATTDDTKELWRQYRSHTSKNVSWIFQDLVANGARQLQDFQPMFDKQSDHPQVLDATKQLGLYTDCLGSARWSIPDEVIGESLAQSLVSAAEILCPVHPITQRELDLWIEHLGPVWNKKTEWMQQALINWYRALQDEGLAPPGPNRMQAFVSGITAEEADSGLKHP